MLLSPDVVDLILSFLQADTAALKSCNQAHPLLSRLAQRHLYYKTTLDIKTGGDLEITELSSLLSNSPHIRNYIRILAINIFNDSDSQLAHETPVVKAVSSILTALPCLNKVTLIHTKPWPSFINAKAWDTIHKTLRSSFADVLQQSSVTKVHLEGFSAFPLSVFDTCQNIKALSLSYCDKFESSKLTSPSPHLESLSIHSRDPMLFQWAIDRIGHLTSLNLKPPTEECTVFRKVFEACAKSLTKLELDIHNLGTSEYFPIDEDFYSNIFPDQSDASRDVELPFTLSDLSHLEHLTISAMIWAVQEEGDFEEDEDEEIVYHDFVFYTALHAIAQLIKSSAPSLSQVVLRLSCSDFSTIDSLVEINWETITLLGDYPTCPHIDLCISCEKFEISPEEMTNTLSRHIGLRQLVDRGVLTIKPETKNSS